MANKSSLENMLPALVAVGNKEQNQQFPPHVFNSIYNTVSSFLKSALIKSYPVGVDILRPFMKKMVIAVVDGRAKLPADFRDMIGVPGISAKKDGTGECGEVIKIESEGEFKLAQLKKGCETRPVVMVTASQWDDKTTSRYKKPTYWNPIGCKFDADYISVCPFDIGHIVLRYATEEKIYHYGYILQPDDTYIYDKASSVESEWGDNAFPYLFRGCLELFSAYLRDPQLTNSSQILNQLGLF